MRVFEKAKKEHTDLLLTERQQLVFQARSEHLGGKVGGWYRSGVKIFTQTGAVKAHDCLQLCRPAGDYVFHGIFKRPRTQAAFMKLLRALREIGRTTCDTANNPATEENNLKALKKMKFRVVEALCDYEKNMPHTELARIIHIIVHFADIIHRWNNVRNFWAFFSERYISA